MEDVKGTYKKNVSLGRHRKRKRQGSTKSEPAHPFHLACCTSSVWKKSSMFSNIQSGEKKGRVAFKRCLLTRFVSAFKDTLCTFIRFLIEGELRSLRLPFIEPAAYFLLTERRGPWIQGSHLYFSLVSRGTVGKLMAFYHAQGQTR